MRKRYPMPKPHHKGRGRSIKRTVFFLFTALVLLSTWGLIMIDNALLPTIVTITNLHSKSKINNVINESLAGIITDYSLASSDFYTKTEDAGGKINSLSVNTILVNQLCSQLAVDISERLSASEIETVGIPVGTLLGIKTLANYGPQYNIKIMPLGDAIVEYETSFNSAGINQINFQVWLNIESTMQIVNPLQDKEITITRKVPLVNTIFSGEIPANMIRTNIPSTLSE